ncbi:MAG: DNA-directed RNA polymerase subunit N [Candidatus Micrarchaeota archaeon]
MEFPIRCFTCGAVIGDMYDEYKNLLSQGAEKALNKLGVNRYCCRRMFISHVEMKDIITKYSK